VVTIPPAPPYDPTPRALASWSPEQGEYIDPPAANQVELDAWCEAVRGVINNRYRELRAGGVERVAALRTAFDEVADALGGRR
jgi:hypothetical protein